MLTVGVSDPDPAAWGTTRPRAMSSPVPPRHSSPKTRPRSIT